MDETPRGVCINTNETTNDMPSSSTPTPVLGRIELTHLELLSHANDIAHMGNRTFAEVLAMMKDYIAERNAGAAPSNPNTASK
jgi:hypothetical protein